MLLDEAIERLEKGTDYNCWGSEEELAKGYEDFQVAYDLAVDIMRRYQKIEEIVNDRYGKPVFKTLDKIIKVVEDGNDN